MNDADDLGTTGTADELPVDEVLERQRAEHGSPSGAAPEPDDELGALINNTGFEGGAASG